MSAILARWSEPHRAYHTLQHLAECLAWLDLAGSEAHQPDRVELALWYHDAIYRPLASDNEAASAGLAVEHLGAAGAPADLVDAVQHLVMATAHSGSPPAGDPALIVDIDLAILGSPPDRYMEYERQIRMEYRAVPGLLFRRRRIEVLRGFLDRPAVYATPLLAGRLEAQARVNMNQALKGLAAGAEPE